MWGCRLCVRIQDNWTKFEEVVDDVVLIAVREGGWRIKLKKLWKVQLENEIVGKVLRYDDHTKIGHIKLEYF